MKIVVIGKGAREDAISQKLLQENNEVYLINENNMRNYNVNININDFKSIKNFCLSKKIELLIVGPEDLLVNGIVDYFVNTNIKVFGPKQQYTNLESSKIYAKNFMKRNRVKTANFKVFSHLNENKIKEIIIEKNGILALKYDGLAAGKGVLVSDNIRDALKNLETLKNIYGSNLKLVIERKLIGREISIMSITDGENIRLFQPTQDYKLSQNGNKGINTGGMGAITPLKFINDSVMKEINNKIIEPTIKGFKKEGIEYIGFLYFGIILTSEGPYLLEYNIRLGDPETQVLLPSMDSNFTNLIMKTISKDVKSIKEIKFDNEYYISLVLASSGYPRKYEINKKVTIKNIDNCNIYYAGIKKNENGELLTNGGRVLNIISSDKSIENLIKKVYSCADKINFENKYYRKDIGKIY